MVEHSAIIGPVDYDSELQRHNKVLQRAWGIGSRDFVLDVGCGAGQTTRDAARLAKAGRALGVDVSTSMIERARSLAQAEGLGNVAFVHGDAAVHPFPSREFDVAISRFGTMFFPAPATAFANLARSLRHGGRLVMMVWQAAENNEWVVSIRQALAMAMPVTSPSAPDAFSLGDPKVIQHTLDAAGFADIEVTDVSEPVYYGEDTAAALDWVCGFSTTKAALEQMTPADRERALAALRETLSRHDTRQGIWLDSRAWLVTARRP